MEKASMMGIITILNKEGVRYQTGKEAVTQ